ncbi:hypothetical protein TeGR_g8170, partial [Tetraparma gracilis]
GYTGDVITVKAGYMRNHLYPGKKAVYATPSNLALFATPEDPAAAARAAAAAAADASAEAKVDPKLAEFRRYMQGRVVRVKRAVDGGGRLLKGGSVNAEVFREKLLGQHKVELEEGEGVKVPEVKAPGEFVVEVELQGGVAEVNMEVVAR